VAEGETVDVGTKLAVISDGAPASAAPAASAPAAEAAPAPPPPAQEPAPARPAKEAPAAPAPAAQAPPGESSEPAAADAPAPVPPSPGRSDGPGLVLSPVVRRLIAEHDLDPAAIAGTGAGGRITRSDVLAFIDSNNGRGPAKTRPAPAVAGAPSAAAAPSVAAFPPASPGEHDEIVPFTNIRRRTAEHMVRSKATSAHTMVAFEVDYSGVEKVRAAVKSQFREAEGFSLTYLPFIARAVVDAIEDFPHVNSSVGDDTLIVHHDVNIGIAVDLDFEGLLVPVIHEADGKRLRVLAREVSALASKARAKRLTMDDISGGTFTITNAGPFGTFITVPVINQPQVAILSTDGVRKRPVVVELPDGTDAIAIHPVGNLVMSWDHRAFDGAYASAFLRAIKEIIETRDWSAEL
jgi:pyruvate dehydrogenase E2 component (dihydrolipoamide acetyltransferase)